MSLVDEGIRPTFGGHEKFVFRYGWLKKGVDTLSKNPAVCKDDDALVVLGVGKYMVRSLRVCSKRNAALDRDGVCNCPISQLDWP